MDIVVIGDLTVLTSSCCSPSFKSTSESLVSSCVTLVAEAMAYPLPLPNFDPAKQPFLPHFLQTRLFAGHFGLLAR